MKLVYFYVFAIFFLKKRCQLGSKTVDIHLGIIILFLLHVSRLPWVIGGHISIYLSIPCLAMFSLQWKSEFQFFSWPEIKFVYY